MCPLLCVNRATKRMLLVSLSVGLYVVGDLCVHCCV